MTPVRRNSLGIVVTLVVVYTIALGPIDRNPHVYARHNTFWRYSGAGW